MKKKTATTKQTNQTYMIQCKRFKKQYIGETNRTLCVCFKQHRQATNNPLHANTTAAESLPHFNQLATRSQIWNLFHSGITTYSQHVTRHAVRQEKRSS